MLSLHEPFHGLGFRGLGAGSWAAAQKNEPIVIAIVPRTLWHAFIQRCPWWRNVHSQRTYLRAVVFGAIL